MSVINVGHGWYLISPRNEKEYIMVSNIILANIVNSNELQEAMYIAIAIDRQLIGRNISKIERGTRNAIISQDENQ